MKNAKGTKVFVALFEVASLGDGVLGSDVTGAFVRCYVVATNEADAVQKFECALKASGVSVSAREWCVQEDSVDWENPESKEGEEMIAKALSAGEVVFGEFHAWSDD